MTSRNSLTPVTSRSNPIARTAMLCGRRFGSPRTATRSFTGRCQIAARSSAFAAIRAYGWRVAVHAGKLRRVDRRRRTCARGSYCRQRAVAADEQQVWIAFSAHSHDWSGTRRKRSCHRIQSGVSCRRPIRRLASAPSVRAAPAPSRSPIAARPAPCGRIAIW